MSTTTAQSVRASSPHKTQLFSTSWPLLTFSSLAFATGHPYGILWLLDFARLLNYSGRALLVDIISEYLQFGRDIPMVLWVYKLTCNHHNCTAVDCVCVHRLRDELSLARSFAGFHKLSWSFSRFHVKQMGPVWVKTVKTQKSLQIWGRNIHLPEILMWIEEHLGCRSIAKKQRNAPALLHMPLLCSVDIPRYPQVCNSKPEKRNENWQAQWCPSLGCGVPRIMRLSDSYY